MPVLSNPRHELFAQELAKGTEAEDAYVIAGFVPNGGNARRLKMNEAVKKRVEAILSDRVALDNRAMSKAIEKLALTKQWVLERLVENANRAMQAMPVTDEDGNVIGEFQHQGSVANRALELIGKELGMFIDRKEIGVPGEFRAFEGMTTDELRAYVRSGASGASEAGVRDEAPGDPGGRGARRGELH